MNDGCKPPRRSFLQTVGGLILVLGSVILGESVGWPHKIKFKRGNREKVPSEFVKELKAGTPALFKGARAWLTLAKDNEVVALDLQCSHKGCDFVWNSEKRFFECPCHGSTFAYDGSSLNGPALRPLSRLEVHQTSDGGLRLVDKPTKPRKKPY